MDKNKPLIYECICGNRIETTDRKGCTKCIVCGEWLVASADMINKEDW